MLKLAGQSQAAFRPDLKPDAALDEDDVAAAVSAMTGIPVSKLGADERTRYAGMVEALHQRIIGQEEAVTAIALAFASAKAHRSRIARMSRAPRAARLRDRSPPLPMAQKAGSAVRARAGLKRATHRTVPIPRGFLTAATRAATDPARA